MSLELYGYAKAHIPGGGKDGKGGYVSIGTVFTDDQERLVMKIDALPLPNSAWSGWVNIFKPSAGRTKSLQQTTEVNEDDIPF